jgi:hypothetical protein
MKKPTQEEFDTCRDVLEYMSAHTTENEPWAVNTITSIENVISENSFEESDYK